MPSDVVFHVSPDARRSVPSGSAFSFLGTAGAPVWLLPETQDEQLLWPGWSTELIPDQATAAGVRWSLTDLTGPGEFALFASDPVSLGAVRVLFNSRDGITSADSFEIPKATHAHGNWAFSAEGVYCLKFERRATLTPGGSQSVTSVLAVAVGAVDPRQVDPGQCFAAPTGQPTDPDRSPIPDSALTPDSTGDVRVIPASAGFTPGQLVSVQLDVARAGQWVSPWLHSQPTWLGWKQVDAAGTVQFRLPADAPAGSHRVVLKDRQGELIGWSALTVAAPGKDEPPVEPPVKDPTYPKSQCVAGSRIISAGHLDYASRIVGGRLQSLIGDDTGRVKVYREPDAVVLWLKPSSAVKLPAGYGAIGPVGSTVWQAPQSQNRRLIWLGWNTEALNSGNAKSPVTWTLTKASGPGSVKVYTGGSFGGVNLVLNGAGSRYRIPLGVHAHANWAFSAKGIYRLTFTQSVTLANGQRSSDTETLRIAVGDVDPSAAAGGTGCGAVPSAASEEAQGAPTSAEQAAASAALDGAGSVPPPSSGAAVAASPDTVINAASPVPLLLGTLGGLLLVGAAGAGTLWRRRRPTIA